MVVLVADAAEQFPRPEPERRQKLLERGDPRKAGAARPAREVLFPEDVRRSRLLRRIRKARVAHDLRRVLEGHLRVEARKQRLEKSGAGLGAREVERLEDVVGRNHRPDNRATMSLTRNRASSLNQKSRKGSWSRAWSNRAIAAARERSLMAV